MNWKSRIKGFLRLGINVSVTDKHEHYTYKIQLKLFKSIKLFSSVHDLET